MPRQSDTGNVKTLCGCGRAQWSSCAHPWYVDYKAAKDHPTRPNDRYRKNLDVASGRHATNLREAQDEARRAITAWLDGRNPSHQSPLSFLAEAVRRSPTIRLTSSHLLFHVGRISIHIVSSTAPVATLNDRSSNTIFRSARRWTRDAAKSLFSESWYARPLERHGALWNGVSLEGGDTRR